MDEIPRTILDKAGDGGYDFSEKLEYGQSRFLDPLFWQALGKACEWKDEEREYKGGIQVIPGWRSYAIGFCRRNFGGSFESAVKWLENIIK